MSKKKRVILVGKGASGKDYFKEWMREQGYPVDVSYTTRPKRVGEIEGQTYHYVTEEQFLNLKDKGFFYEDVQFAGMRYGTPKNQWEEGALCIKTPSGIAQLTTKDREESLIVFFDIPFEVRKERLSKRSDFDSVDRRLEADEKDFKDFTTFDLKVSRADYDPAYIHKLIKYFID